MITLTSKIDIKVTPNLKVKDLTDKNSINPDKLKAVMVNEYEPVLIMQGTYEYPEYILEWETVQTLIANKIFVLAADTQLPKQKPNKQNKQTKATKENEQVNESLEVVEQEIAQVEEKVEE